jgi:DNA-binding CsgD family transcriptional regulator
MTLDEVGDLAAAVLGAPPGPVLTGLLAKAGGNPLWARAILRILGDEGLLRSTVDAVDATTSQLPASLGELVVRRLRDLPPETLELLQVTAVLGDAVSVHDVAALAGRPPAEVAARLGEAFDAYLLDEVDERVVFRHPLVHDAVYQHLPAPARRLLHRQAAVALVAAGADRLDVADHLLHGAERGDEEAVSWLREAAREASAQAPLVAVELLRRAEALLPPTHPDADGVSAELVQALLRAGLVTEASSLAESVLGRRHAAEVDVPVRLALLGALALQNRAEEVVSVAEATLAMSPGLHPVQQVPVLAQQSWAHTLSGDQDAGAAVARRALAVAEEAGDAAMTVWALSALLVAVGRQGRYGEALDHARRAAALAAREPVTRALPLQPAFFLGLALFDCDLLPEARAAYREALDDEFTSGWWLSDTLLADAVVSFARGQWDDAVPSLVAGAQAARDKGNALLLTQSLAYRVIIATGVGDLRAARELATGIVASLEGDRLGYNAGILGSAVAALLAAEGDDDGAYEVLLRCWRFEADRGDRFYHRCLAPDLVRLALALGHPEVAAEVADVVAAGVALAPEVASVRSLALRCRGLVLDDPELLLEAVEAARQASLLVDHAGACEDAAASLARCGRDEEASALLSEALERYERAGADAWAARVRAGLRALGEHPAPRGPRERPTEGWASLTATERSVSVLVAEGLTNGAVARRLYISPHTVNTHLRHVFAKLGVSNRVALAGVVNRSIE